MRYAFHDYELDDERLELRRDGVTVTTQPKVIDLLLHMIRHRDRVVLRSELVEAVWRGINITDSALSQVILRVRKAIGDELQQTLVTVHGRGFRFAPEVVQRPGSFAGPAQEPPDDATFVGRESAFAALHGHVDVALSGQGCLVLLTGDPGVGKSRLAARVLRLAAQQGARERSPRARRRATLRRSRFGPR
jgi:DNA-binding winged helix-turn-helix (wHTH) protein